MIPNESSSRIQNFPTRSSPSSTGRALNGGESRGQNAVLQHTPGLCHNCASDLFSYFKSTIDLCYGIVVGVQPT